MTPRHRVVLDAIPPGSSGRYMSSIHAAMAVKVSALELLRIMDDLVRDGLVTRSSDQPPALFKRTERNTP